MILFSFFLFSISLVLTCNGSLLFGTTCKDGCILTSSGAFAPNGVTVKQDFDWVRPVGSKALVGMYGDSSDCEFLFDHLVAMNRDHELSFGRSMSCRSLAHVCRTIISRLLRSQPLKVSLLFGGFDEIKDEAVLYWLDSIGSIQKMPYGAHGREFLFILSLLDRKVAESSHRVQFMKNDDTPSEIVPQCTVPPPCEGAVGNLLTGTHVEGTALPRSMTVRTESVLCSMTLREGLDMIRDCWNSAGKRTVGQFGRQTVHVLSRQGYQQMGDIKNL